MELSNWERNLEIRALSRLNRDEAFMAATAAQQQNCHKLFSTINGNIFYTVLSFPEVV